MDELHKALNDEMSKLIKWEAEADMESAALKDKLREAEELAYNLDISAKQHNQERGQLNEELRGAKHSREKLDLKSVYTKVEAAHALEVHTNTLAEVEGKKKKIGAEISINFGGRFDDLIQAIENMRLETINFREMEMERNSKVQWESGLKMESCIEEYLIGEDKVEELKTLLNQKTLEGEELDQMLLKAITEKEEIGKKCAERTNKLEKLRKETREREMKTKATRTELERKIEEKRLKIETLRREKTDLAVKQAEAEAATMRKKQELTNLTELKAANIQGMRDEEERGRKIKENCRGLMEKMESLNEEIERLKSGVADRSKVESERDLRRENLLQTKKELAHLEKEVAGLSKVEQQVDTLQQEKANLLARTRLLKEKNSSYLEEASTSKKRLEFTEGRQMELEEKIYALINENENLSKEEETLIEALKLSGGKLEKSKESFVVKGNELAEALEALQTAEVRHEKLRSEDEQLKDCVSALKEKIGKQRNETLMMTEENERLKKKKEDLDEYLKTILIENSTTSKQALEDLEKVEKLEKDLAEITESEPELLQELENIKKEEEKIDSDSIEVEKNIKQKAEILRTSEDKKRNLIETLEKLKNAIEVNSNSADNLKIRDDLKEAEDEKISIEKDFENWKEEFDSVKKEKETLILQIEEVDLEAKSQKEKLNQLQKEEEMLNKARLEAQDEVEKVSSSVAARQAALRGRSAEVSTAQQEENKLLETIAGLEERKEKKLRSFRERLEQMAVEQRELVKPWEEKRNHLNTQIEEIEESLEKLEDEIRKKNFFERKERLEQDIQEEALIEEKKNIENKMKEIQKKLSILKGKPEFVENPSQQGSVKRKLGARQDTPRAAGSDRGRNLKINSPLPVTSIFDDILQVSCSDESSQ